jgi:hypothetical protein
LCTPLFDFWNERLGRDHLALEVHEEAKQYPSLLADEQRLARPLLRSLRSCCNLDRPKRSLIRVPAAALTEFIQLVQNDAAALR